MIPKNVVALHERSHIEIGHDDLKMTFNPEKPKKPIFHFWSSFAWNEKLWRAEWSPVFPSHQKNKKRIFWFFLLLKEMKSYDGPIVPSDRNNSEKRKTPIFGILVIRLNPICGFLRYLVAPRL